MRGTLDDPTPEPTLVHRVIPPLIAQAPARARTTALVAVVAVLAAAAGGAVLASPTARAAEPAPRASAAPSNESTAEPEMQQERGPVPADEAQRTAERAAGKAGGRGHQGRRAPVPEVPFTCDPTKTHGQNVSAYARSLPQGPGRGRQVSQAARSDCGKPGRGPR